MAKWEEVLVSKTVADHTRLAPPLFRGTFSCNRKAAPLVATFTEVVLKQLKMKAKPRVREAMNAQGKLFPTLALILETQGRVLKMITGGSNKVPEVQGGSRGP